MNKTKYSPETAGKRMIENVPLAFPEEIILDVKKKLFKEIGKFETINYVYVIGKDRKLVGVFSIKEIFRKPEETKIKDIMKKNLITARPYTDQERVAILALRNNLKAIPVIDKEGKFLGVVPSDIILDILHFEHVEDFLQLGGIPKIDTLPQNLIKTPSSILAKTRLPWLIFGIFGEALGAQIIRSLEGSLKIYFALAAFIPLILYTAGAVSTQTLALTIRNLAFDAKISLKKYLLKEIKIGFLLALVLGLLLSLISGLFYQQPYFIGFILGVSLFLAVVCAISIGFLIPWTLQKFKKDPAIGSGPFTAVITDLSSLAIYFLVIKTLLSLFI
jgi:magnesium transporter